MSIHISLSKENVEESDANVHLLPCTIKFDGDAKVSKYFEPNIVKNDDNGLTASFRGYPLMGAELTLPAGYRGFVLFEANEKMSEDTERSIYVSEQFKKFHYWNYDKLPSVNDSVQQAINWISIANIIHSPTD